MPYEPLHHKYRPQTFSDLIGQETISLTLSNALKQEKIAPAYLFTGPRGTGKTSSARILAKSLNCLTSSQPTPDPCGECEACLAIAKGSAMSVVEIDAASHTGVDNIREVIQRAGWGKIEQRRYKIYIIDECLTGESLIQTSEGLMRIDNPTLKGKMILSYNENTELWEYKKVIRWLERGTKETLIIKTSDHQIRCTENHLIRTERGWIEAKNVQEGMKILSPVSVDVEQGSTNTARMDGCAALQQDISLKETNTEQNPVENGYQIYNNTQFPQWTTNLEKVESVCHAGHEKVYDLEVEDNHNFVANGLLVHNCHMLSTAAFNALLKTLEEPPPNVVFILATTDPQRVLSTIISRCQRFDYRRIPLAEMTKHLKYIADAENIAIADEAITLIAQIANGGLRDAESLLDQLSLLPEKISVAKVWDLVGAVPEQDLLELLRSIRNNLPVKILQQCRSLLDRGREPLVVLQNLASFYLNLLIAKTAPQRPDMVAVTETCWQELCREATNWDIARILRGQQQLKEGETHLKNTTQPRLWLEVTLLELLANSNLPDTTIQLESVVNLPISASAKPDNSASTFKTQLKTPSVNGAIFDNNNPSVNTTPSQAIVPNSSCILEPERNKQEAQSDRATVQEVNNTPPEIPSHTLATVSQSAKPVVEPPPKIAAQNPHVATNNLANEEIWNKVVSCLHPPTTQALFKQQCHLVSFEGSSAIVGISSVKLQGLHQGKVANIEAAFAQVCQRKIKVQLEVASPKHSSANNSLTSIDNLRSQTPKFSQNSTSHTPSLADNHQISQPKADYSEATEQNFRIQQQATEIHKLNSPVAKSSELVSNSQFSVNEVSVLPTSESIANRGLNQHYTDDNLQQAINNLTHSFEGELVQLENAQNQFFKVVATSEQPEITASSQGRPNVEDYDDEW